MPQRALTDPADQSALDAYRVRPMEVPPDDLDAFFAYAAEWVRRREGIGL